MCGAEVIASTGGIGPSRDPNNNYMRYKMSSKEKLQELAEEQLKKRQEEEAQKAALEAAREAAKSEEE